MKRLARAALVGVFAAYQIFLATSLASGAAGVFAVEALTNGQTISDARAFGTIESNGVALPGKHFVPDATVAEQEPFDIK